MALPLGELSAKLTERVAVVSVNNHSTFGESAPHTLSPSLARGMPEGQGESATQPGCAYRKVQQTCKVRSPLNPPSPRGVSERATFCIHRCVCGCGGGKSPALLFNSVVLCVHQCACGCGKRSNRGENLPQPNPKTVNCQLKVPQTLPFLTTVLARFCPKR